MTVAAGEDCGRSQCWRGYEESHPGGWDISIAQRQLNISLTLKVTSEVAWCCRDSWEDVHRLLRLEIQARRKPLSLMSVLRFLARRGRLSGASER